MTKEIHLTRGKVALVDDADYEYLSQYKWFTDKGIYAARNIRVDGKQTLSYMHVEIMGKRDGMEIDHIDLDGLNNQRENLRHCTHAENMKNRKMSRANTSGYRGIVKAGLRYQATVMADGIAYYSDKFDNIMDAAKEHDKLAIEHHGEFAVLNFTD
jgi:hypothetical protein